MLETTQNETVSENLLIRDENPKSEIENLKPYDAEAKNRFEYELDQDGLLYDVAYIFGGLTDERYLQWLRELKVKGDDEEVSQEAREASVRLWDDLAVGVEGVDHSADEDWKTFFDSQEKIDSLNDYMAVAVVGADEKATKGFRRDSANETQTVLTEAWLNGDAVKQKHILKKKSFELEKKYARIQSKRFKQETTRGLRRKAKIEFVPQDEKLGELYDEMFVSCDGFAKDTNIPLRFKTTVIHHIFQPKLDAKKSQK